jgi:hypothetical protein
MANSRRATTAVSSDGDSHPPGTSTYARPALSISQEQLHMLQRLRSELGRIANKLDDLVAESHPANFEAIWRCVQAGESWQDSMDARLPPRGSGS